MSEPTTVWYSKGVSKPLRCDFDTDALLEIKVRSDSIRWTKVDPLVFRSWTGSRRINGEDYQGPHYYYLSNDSADHRVRSR